MIVSTSDAGVPAGSTDEPAGDRPGQRADRTDGAEAMRTSLPPLSDSAGRGPSSAKQDGRRMQILAACRARDLHALRALATSEGGFADDETRRTAWPLLLGCEGTPPIEHPAWQHLPRHRDEDQVGLDVDRSFVYYPSDESDKLRAARKVELSGVITQVLRRHPLLCYFQGYHDIVQVLLLVLGADAAVPAARRLSLLRIRDFMLPTMAGAISHLTLLPAILSAADQTLYEHLSQTAPFYFALPATLTLYAHDIQEYGDIARLFDFLLANQAVVSVYLFAVIVLSRKDELLELEADEHDMLHSILSKLPKPLDLDGLIERASALYQAHPPERLAGWAWYHISPNSVLKTTRHPRQLAQQSLQDGERFFSRHSDDIRRQEDRQRRMQQARQLALRYRRPALATGTAIFVAVLALYMRRPGVSAMLTDCAGSLLKVVQRLLQ